MNEYRRRRVRLWVKVATIAGTALTSITVKLQQRDNDGATVGGYNDLPSNLDDAQGSAQPKAPTFEVSHAFAVTAANTAWFKFYLEVSAALHDIIAVVSANAAGKAGESITIYAQA